MADTAAHLTNQVFPLLPVRRVHQVQEYQAARRNQKWLDKSEQRDK